MNGRGSTSPGVFQGIWRGTCLVVWSRAHARGQKVPTYVIPIHTTHARTPGALYACVCGRAGVPGTLWLFLVAWWVHACAESIIGRYNMYNTRRGGETRGQATHRAHAPCLVAIWVARVWGPAKNSITTVHDNCTRAHMMEAGGCLTKKKVKTGDVAPPLARTMHTNPRRWRRAARTLH